MIDLLSLEFARNALVAGLLASVVCGILGTLVVVNRIVFLAGGIAHAAYGGIGLALFMGWPYLPATVGFCLAAAAFMAAVAWRAPQRADTVIGVTWAVGMAVGVVLLDKTPGYTADLMSYLFGSILAVSRAELVMLAALAAGLTAAVVLFYDGLLLASYDAEFARARGVPAAGLYGAMVTVLAVALVLVIRMVGLLLVLALLTVPPFIMERHCRSLGRMMAGSVALCAAFTACGLALSFRFDLTAGASIILVAAAGFFAELLLGRMARKAAKA